MLQTIPLTNLLPAFLPILILLWVMRQWSLRAWDAVYATGRMLLQLLAIGYLLTYIFRTNQPLVIVAVIVMMIAVSAWIAMRPLKDRGLSQYALMLVAIGATGLPMLFIVTQLTLDMPRWFEPRFVVPLAGMVFANSMNTVCLAAERFRAEQDKGVKHNLARRAALDAALIPQINTLFAVGLVSLPGMMTGQILSGVDPLVAVRYQIMVMFMIFGAAGLGAACYLVLQTPKTQSV